MRLLIVGTGLMGGHHAVRFGAMDGVEITGAVDVRQEVLGDFRARHKIKEGFASLEEALDWDGFDAACVVTPDSAHHAATMPLLAAGKHVLCEKPLAPNFADADEMASAADRAGVVNMVNLTYRKSRALARARQLVEQGAVGEVRHIEASYLQSWLTQDAWGDWRTQKSWLWRLSSRHGSLGVLGDVGVHLIDFACHATGLGVAKLGCRLKNFDKAKGGRIGEYLLDANDSAAISATMGNGALCVMHATRYASGKHNEINLRVHGTKGGLQVTYSNTPTEIDGLGACTGDDIRTTKWREVELGDVPTVMDLFAQNVADGNNKGEPSFAHAARLQRVIDTAFEADRQDRTLKV